MSNDMWNKIFNLKTFVYMKKASGDTEDDESISPFVDLLISKVDYKVIVLLATQWHIYNDEQQIKMAENYVEVHHISRFLLLMDYLSYRYKKGDLK